jgi:hypothetical protein
MVKKVSAVMLSAVMLPLLCLSAYAQVGVAPRSNNTSRGVGVAPKSAVVHHDENYRDVIAKPGESEVVVDNRIPATLNIIINGKVAGRVNAQSMARFTVPDGSNLIRAHGSARTGTPSRDVEFHTYSQRTYFRATGPNNTTVSLSRGNVFDIVIPVVAAEPAPAVSVATPSTPAPAPVPSTPEPAPSVEQPARVENALHEDKDAMFERMDAQLAQQPQQPAADGRTAIEVKTAAEFVAAIGPNRNILLKEGVYNLSTDDLRDINNEHVTWEKEFDGWQMDVRNVQNMTIRSAGDKPAELIVDPRYTFVIQFYDSKNITIENVVAGHSEGGYCLGGVFGFSNCSDIKIDRTYMYGSGTVGLQLNNVVGMEVTNSTIYECTYCIILARDSRNISFKNCLFRDNQEFSMVEMHGTRDVVFDGCEFRNNRVDSDWSFFFQGEGGSENIQIKNTKFVDNQAKFFKNSDIFTFENCTFSGNSFSSP